jgi:phosphatidylinositol alpha-mannosyltransferase
VRVALLCPYSLSRPGGVQGQVTGLAGALAEAGHSVTVLAPCDDGDVDGIVPGGPVRLVRLGGSVGLPANGSVAPVSLGPMASARAVRAVRDGGFDVLHLHEPLVPGPALACLLACDVPKVGTFHRAGTSVAYRIFGLLARRAAGRLAVRCAVSDQARSTARQSLGGTYEVVGNGVDLERFAAADPWPTAGPTVLFIGRHEQRKGLAVLLDAVERLGAGTTTTRAGAARGAGPTVWVAGSGPATVALQRRHPPGDRLVWLGRVSDEELASRLAGADVLCAPSLGGESFGVVLLEAMAARTAVVASDIPGYAAVVGDHAVLVRPGDAAALARVLGDVTLDAETRTGRCSAAALDAAADHASQWSMPRVAARYAGIYERVASGRART